MKIRNGFVSNSSSSSFIIAIKKPTEEVCNCCGSFTIDFVDLLRKQDYGETCLHAQGHQNVVAWHKERSGGESWSEGSGGLYEEEKEVHEKIKVEGKKLEQDGYVVVSVSLDDHDRLFRQLLEGAVKNRSAVILDGGEL